MLFLNAFLATFALENRFSDFNWRKDSRRIIYSFKILLKICTISFAYVVIILNRSTSAGSNYLNNNLSDVDLQTFPQLPIC